MAKLSDLVAKAERKPYELELDDGVVISIPQPTLAAWAAAPINQDVPAFLTALGVSAEDAARAEAALIAAPLGTADVLVSSIRGHFGLGN